MAATPDSLDEAYVRLHRTGPEFDGWLSNHGPMAAEAMARHGLADAVSSWLEQYMRRLEEFPRGVGPIGQDWQSALGDPRRIADWTSYFRGQLAERPWRNVLNEWWPRLLPGVAAAATHGVIRVGHSVRCLMADGADDIRTAELAHGLAYWAARWQTVPPGHTGAALVAAAGRARASSIGELLAAVPRIAEQDGGIGDRLTRLEALAEWPGTLSRLSVPADPAQIRARLTELVDAATCGYLTRGHGNAIMLVHTATAPNAVLRTLPALDVQMWASSLAAAWAASSALTAIYAPAESARTKAAKPASAERRPVEPASRPAICADTFGRAVEHGDAHVIKFADTAIDVFSRTGDADSIAAARLAMELVGRG